MSAALTSVTQFKSSVVAISTATTPIIAQTVIDDKTAIGVLYVVAICGFCYGAGVLVTNVKNRQKEASETLTLMQEHFKKVDIVLESIASRQCRIEEQMNTLPCTKESKCKITPKEHLFWTPIPQKQSP